METYEMIKIDVIEFENADIITGLSEDITGPEV